MLPPTPWSAETVELFQITCMIWRHRGDARFSELTGSQSFRQQADMELTRIERFSARYPAAREARRRYLEEGKLTLIP